MNNNDGHHCLCGRLVPFQKIREAFFTCRLLKCTGCGLYSISNRMTEVTGFLRLVTVRGVEQLFEARQYNRISKN